MIDDATSVLNVQLPEISTTEPYSPIARAKASAAPDTTAGRICGSTMRRNTVERRRAERGGGLLGVAVQVDQHRLHGAHHERQRDEQQREEHPAPVPSRLTPTGLSVP